MTQRDLVPVPLLLGSLLWMTSSLRTVLTTVCTHEHMYRVLYTETPRAPPAGRIAALAACRACLMQACQSHSAWQAAHEQHTRRNPV